VKVGDYGLLHSGYAIRIFYLEEAAKTLAIFKDIEFFNFD